MLKFIILRKYFALIIAQNDKVHYLRPIIHNLKLKDMSRSKIITPEQAKELLQNKTSTVILQNGWTVKSINMNNQTCLAEKGQSSMWFDFEKVEFIARNKK